MPIQPSDIALYYSGGSTNDNPLLSIGGAVSSVQLPQTITGNIVTNVLGNLFDTVGRVAANGYTDYRIVYIQNTHATLTTEEISLYFKTPSPELYIVDDKKTPSVNEQIVENYPYKEADSSTSTPRVPGNLYMGIHGAKNVVVGTLANRTTAPSGIVFTQPIVNPTNTDGTLINCPNLDAGDYLAIYIQRVILQGAVGKNVATASISVPYSSAE